MEKKHPGLCQVLQAKQTDARDGKDFQVMTSSLIVVIALWASYQCSLHWFVSGATSKQ